MALRNNALNRFRRPQKPVVPVIQQPIQQNALSAGTQTRGVQAPTQQLVAPPVPGTPGQNPNVLNSLSGGLGQEVQGAIAGQVTGTGMGAYNAASNEAFARAAKDIRARASAGPGALGQGSAIQSQQMAEQNVLSALADKNLNQGIAAENMKQTGVQNALNLSQQNTQADQFAQGQDLQQQQLALTEKLAADANFLQQQGIDQNKAKLFGYTDANGNHIPGQLEIQAQQYKNTMNSQAGQGFANYVATHKDVGLDDPALKNLGQSLWESYGNTGPAPDAWVEAQILAVEDPTLTNPLIATKNMIDEAIKSGVIDQKQGDDFWALFTHMTMNPDGLTVGPDGNIVINDGSGTSNGSGGTSKQQFEGFMADNVPEEYANLVSYDSWVAAGKPKTWEEYNTGVNWSQSIKDKYGEDVRVMVDMEENDQKKIVELINSGNSELSSQFGVSSHTQKQWGEREWGKASHGTEKLNSGKGDIIGRVIKVKNQNGELVNAVGMDYEEGVGSSGTPYQKVKVKDPITGGVIVLWHFYQG